MCHQTTYVGVFDVTFYVCTVSFSHALTLSLLLSDRIPQHTFSARYLGSATMEVGGSRHASLVAALKKTVSEHSHGLQVREKMTVVIRADSIK